MYNEKDMSIHETMETYGCENITTTNLLTAIIGNEKKAKKLFSNIASYADSREDFYNNFQTKKYDYIKAAGNLTDKETTRVMAAIEIGKRFSENKNNEKERIIQPNDAAKVLRKYIGYENHEVFISALVNIKNEIIKIVKIAEGSLTQATVHPREILAPAIINNCAALIIAHNHPSGNPKPSKCDDEITKAINDSCNTIGIGLLDHIIIGVGNNDYYSYKEHGQIKGCK